MARPLKFAIKYFHLPVEFPDQDEILEAEEKLGIPYCDHVLNIAIRLYCLIHKHGYYMKWENSMAYAIAKFAGRTLNSELVVRIVETLAETGFFDQELLKKEGILTSYDLQRGWRSASKSLKRKAVIDKKYELSPRNTKIDSSEEEFTEEETIGTRKQKPVKAEGSDGKQKGSAAKSTESATVNNNNSKEVVKEVINTVIDDKGEKVENSEKSTPREQEHPPLPALPPSIVPVPGELPYLDKLRSPAECLKMYFSYDDRYRETRQSLAGNMFYELINVNATDKDAEVERLMGLLYEWAQQFNVWLVEGESNEKKTVHQWAKHFRNWVLKHKKSGVDMLHPAEFNDNSKSNSHADTRKNSNQGKAHGGANPVSNRQRPDYGDSSRHRGSKM